MNKKRLNISVMANKFDYENMLNTIASKKLTKNTNLGMFTDDEMEAWNSAIDLCYGIVRRRQSKFDTSQSNCTLADVNQQRELLIGLTEYITNRSWLTKQNHETSKIVDDYFANL